MFFLTMKTNKEIDDENAESSIKIQRFIRNNRRKCGGSK